MAHPTAGSTEASSLRSRADGAPSRRHTGGPCPSLLGSPLQRSDWEPRRASCLLAIPPPPVPRQCLVHTSKVSDGNSPNLGLSTINHHLTLRTDTECFRPWIVIEEYVQPGVLNDPVFIFSANEQSNTSVSSSHKGNQATVLGDGGTTRTFQ